MSFDADVCWARRFLPHIKRILGEHLIAEAPIDEDRLHNTDLIVLRLESVRIACRVRRHRYFARYGDQFTVRERRPSGHTSELTKLIEGWGDYVFYGFSDAAEAGLAYWFLGDLRVFRLWFAREVVRLEGELPGVRRANGDGSSTFRVFRLRDLPDAFLFACSPEPQEVPLVAAPDPDEIPF